MNDTAPLAEPVFTITARCTASVDIGIINGGQARMIPIIGGTVAGPRLSGTVLPGADWSIMRGGGVVTVEARYALRADDGAIIQVWNGATDAMGAGGEQRGHAMVTSPRFLAPDGPHGWLNHGVYVGTLMPDPVPGEPQGDFTVRIGIYLMR